MSVIGERNDQLLDRTGGDRIGRREFCQDGARLLSAVLATHRQGGGQLMYGWLADSRQNYGVGYTTAWTANNVGPDDYFATLNGGPYVDLNGTNEALWITDATWQEAGTEELLVWHWCNPRSLAANMGLVGKWDINANNRSWLLYWNTTTGRIEWYCNATGLAVNNVIVQSSLIPVIGAWYLIAGYWQASGLQRIFAGAATDAALTINSLMGAGPASLFDGTAPLAIGTIFNAAPTMLQPWNGYVGIGSTRLNTPAAAINGYMTRLFQMTRWFHQA